MSLSILDIKRIVEHGGGLIISASELSILDLKRIAELSAQSGAKITVKKPQRLSALDLNSIAKKGKGNLVFDFYDI